MTTINKRVRQEQALKRRQRELALLEDDTVTFPEEDLRSVAALRIEKIIRAKEDITNLNRKLGVYRPEEDSMSYDSGPKIMNVALVCAAIVICMFSLLYFSAATAMRNSAKDERINTERMQACTTIEDQTIRSFCIAGYGKGANE